MINKKSSLFVAGALLMASAAFAGTVFAQTAPGNSGNSGVGRGRGHGMMHARMPGIFGTVSAVNGNTLTLTDKKTGAAYTVDASNASVTKNGSASTLSAVSVGDSVFVQGSVNGSNVSATNIRDGMAQGSMMGKHNRQNQGQNPPVQGNGQPVLGGTVTAVNGATITVTNKSNVTYTVDATSAKVEKLEVEGTLSSIAVGDHVIVQGSVNGTSVAASLIIDQGGVPNSSPNAGQKAHTGFFGAINNFFVRLFGF